eukprot:COSAG02_NODE_25799_length_648_cov_14.517304_1_plen_26_part_01
MVGPSSLRVASARASAAMPVGAAARG